MTADGRQDMREGEAGSPSRTDAAVQTSGAQVSGQGQTFALTVAGLIFMAASAAALSALIFRLAFHGIEISTRGTTSTPATELLIAIYTAPLILLAAACIAAFVGYILLRTGGTATRDTIPRQDYPLLSRLLLDNNIVGINQYIRLSSLGGFAGVFAKIGLSGLPLATIGLTVIFTILSLWGGDKIFDLAKLTLGAFIGSYVQQSVTERITAGEERPQSPRP
jgi:hypothetical protein